MMSTGESLALVTEESINNAIQRYRAKTGRPTKYTDELAAEILTRIAQGELITSITADKHVPSWPTIWDWMQHNQAFANAYKRARKGQAPLLIESGCQGLIDCDDSRGNAPVLKADKTAQFKAFMAKCYDRETFGDQSKVEHSGGQVHYHFEAGGSADQEKPAPIDITSQANPVD